jgi:hypothetical protein
VERIFFFACLRSKKKNYAPLYTTGDSLSRVSNTLAIH